MYMKKNRKHLTNPLQIAPDKENGLYQIIIETPKNSRNKFAIDPKQRILTLKKILPAGMSFPYDFGFIPQTMSDDGDPLDVLLLMEEPAFPGCAVLARVIGVIEGVQVEDNKTIRNDRIVAIADETHMYAEINRLKDLPKQFITELGEFFVNYHKLEGKKYKLIGCKGTETARKLIKKAQKAAVV